VNQRTDKELLELAAKAAGVPLIERIGMHRDYFADDRTGNEWNPLTDDGDALRLAVKLKLDIVDAATYVTVWSLGNDDCDEDYGSDPYAATRRAIVRAAAEIGAKL
jgi:hypothetical protein